MTDTNDNIKALFTKALALKGFNLRKALLAANIAPMPEDTAKAILSAAGYTAEATKSPAQVGNMRRILVIGSAEMNLIDKAATDAVAKVAKLTGTPVVNVANAIAKARVDGKETPEGAIAAGVAAVEAKRKSEKLKSIAALARVVKDLASLKPGLGLVGVEEAEFDANMGFYLGLIAGKPAPVLSVVPPVDHKPEEAAAETPKPEAAKRTRKAKAA